MNKSIVVVAAFLCALPGAVQASCHPNCPAPTGASGGGLSLADTAASVVVRASIFRSVDKFVLGAGLGHAFPAEPMRPGKLHVKAVPGVWRSVGQADEYQTASEFRGYLLGGSVLYGINQHWGVNFTGIYEESRSGSAQPVVVTGAQDTPVRMPGQADGYILAVGAVYDPIAGPRFRLPIVAGLGYNYYSATVEGTFAAGSDTFRYHGNHKVSRASLYLGVAPQADYRSFRFTPFAIASDSAFFGGKGTSTVELGNLASGERVEQRLTYSEVTYLSAGLTVKYLPWNLGVSYIRGDMLSRGIDTDVYSLTLEKTW